MHFQAGAWEREKGVIRLMVRKIIAVVTGAILASMIPALLFLATSKLDSYSSLFLVFYMYSFFAISAIGLPCFILLRRLGVANLWSALILGFISGALISLGVSGLKNITVQNLMLLGATGAVTASVFWFTWILFKPASKKL